MTSTGAVGSWRLAVRLPTLPAAVAPVIVGTGVAIAADEFTAGPAVAALAGAVCLQVVANLANDVFDFKKGADTAERVGPPRATQSGVLSERQVFAGLAVMIAISIVIGVYLTAVAGWAVVAIGLASIAAALAYTGGPWPFGYHALGDLFTFVFFGIVAVVGTYFVQAEELVSLAWYAAVPMGCTVTAILVVNNLRDIPTDRETGKTTLAVLMGNGATRTWFVVLVGVAYVSALATWVFSDGGAWVLLTLASLPFAVPPLRAILGGSTGGVLNNALKGTARFHLAFGILLAVGIAIS